MNGIEIFLLAFAAICVLAALAARINLTFPIMFVLGGIALALGVPELADISIEPHHILFVFLPPLLMEAAYFTSLRDFRAALLPIMQLAVGLVLFTVVITGFVADHLIPGMTFALGAVLGAIISPPDAVAATSILRHLRIPKRVVTILEGESLVNDASALVLYALAVAAVTTGGFSLAHASMDFVWMAGAGTAVGLCIGYGYIRFFPLIREPSIEILSTFLLPYTAYAVAEAAHASGVLAVVAAGLYIAWHSPRLFNAEFRLSSVAVWKMVVFILNALVFLLIGLKVPGIVAAQSTDKTLTLIGYAAGICVAALIIRLIWVFVMAYGTRYLFPKSFRKEAPPWQNVFVVAWTGMRGVVSLATALALPYTLADGITPFPMREEILFITLCVILFTLIGQGLTLPFILRKLPLIFNPRLAHEDWYARLYAARQALSRLNELSDEYELHGHTYDRIKGYYEDRIASLGDGPNTPLAPDEMPGARNHPYIRAQYEVWKEVLKAEEQAVLALRKSFHIGDDVMHDLLRDIDLLAHRFR